MADQNRHPSSASPLPSSGRFTEVRMVMSAYGPAKVEDDGAGHRALLMPPLRAGVRLVPYIERDTIGGAFRIAPERATQVDAKTMRYPVVDVLPAFALGPAERQEITEQLSAAAVNEHFGAAEDLMTAIKTQLAGCSAVDGATHLTPGQLAANLASVQASPQFANVYLLETLDGAHFVLSIGIPLASLRAAHAFFAKVDEAGSTRLRCAARGDVWLAPLG